MSRPLDGVRALISDLDGVVFRGAQALPHAVETLNGVAEERIVVYATNNASRTPAAVERLLADFGLGPSPLHVVTSAMAGARVVRQRLEALGRDGAVLAVGGPGVAAALKGQGLDVVDRCDDDAPPVAVMQGYGAETPWSAFAEASYAVQRGAFWCLTNEDRTIPTARGIAPGNGMGGAAVAAATGVSPLVAGKPHAPIYELALEIAGVPPGEALAVGDRLDTDIEGAYRIGMASAFVLTGVHDLPDVATASVTRRPAYVLENLGALTDPYRQPQRVAYGFMCGAARAVWSDGVLSLSGGAPIERARAAIALAWHLLDSDMVAASDLRRNVPTWARLDAEGRDGSK